MIIYTTSELQVFLHQHGDFLGVAAKAILLMRG